MKSLNWQSSSTGNRHEVIESIKTIISKNGGYISMFNMFSDLALAVTIVIEAKWIAGLYHDINGIAPISEEISQELRNNSSQEWNIFLNLTFARGSGKLKIEVSDVPG